ncbi:TonB-dependent receptor [Allomuricauda sp. SCSIO 65647]|uniref:SusC/RagA family TonB-linked outer membrane protein n=1 Tax=Allomuricauda sp. SCSIO 65647 TaxID=2908843 RepID=UPI001F19249A|nr:TonB-dependent receptor [Muricauda sp. SCSIO 65647]UJH67042.1 TonB-dependent receptor [Muricauda sp. SCSIO 65647]
MKTLIFLCCTAVFSIVPKHVLSQNAKIRIDTDKEFTVDEVFDLIMEQTDYTFIYQVDAFENYPKVHLKKGIIEADDLLQKSLSKGEFEFRFTSNNTIVVKRKSKQVLSEPAQQTFKIQGKIIDKDGQPLPGITVIISKYPPTKNAAPSKDFLIRGTATDFDGSFEIEAELNHYLIATAIGYENHVERISTEQTTYTITLKESLSKLNEVVIVGYGAVKKKDLTGSISNIKGSELVANAVSAPTVDEMLSGRLSGVFVTQNSGAPGAGATINIRGLSSINGDNQPLYVIDGVPIVITPRDAGSLSVERENPLLAIPPRDIESVDILKDASSAAIYGARAANGVVIVTTKRGRKNQDAKLNVDYNYALQTPVNTYEVLDTEGYAQYVRAIDPNTGITIGEADTDWFDEILNTNAGMHNLNVGVSGGTTTSNYALSGSLLRQDGIIKRSGLDRYGIRGTIDNDLLNRTIKIGATLSYNYSENDLAGIQLFDVIGFRPDIPIRDETGNFVSGVTGGGFPIGNPVADNQADITAFSRNLLANGYIDLKLAKGLHAKSSLSISDLSNNTESFKQTFNTEGLFLNGGVKDLSRFSNRTTTFENTLTYDAKLGENHTLNVLGGISWNRIINETFNSRFVGFTDNDLTNIGSGTFSSGNETKDDYGLNSLFGRLNYSFADKYLLTLTARSDGSSKFGPNNQRGFFPSGALAWKIHNENFLKDSQLINQLKLRISAGRTGLDNLPGFLYQPFFVSDPTTNYVDDNGLKPTNVPNPNIKWETTDQFDIGLDFGLFNDRLYGTLGYYTKYTKDLLLFAPISPELGFSRQYANVGEVSNKGWEVEIGGRLFDNRDFKWNTNFNISGYKNVVEKLNEGTPTINGPNSRVIEGEALGSIRAHKVEGFIQNQAELDALNAASPTGFYQNTTTGVGDYKFKDINGDNVINADDTEIIGNVQPDVFGGWNNRMSFKSFEFSFLFQFSFGNYKRWNAAQFYILPNVNTNTFADVFDQTWSANNRDAQYPALGSQDPGGNFRDSDRLYYDASFIRFKNWQLAYNLPTSVIEKAHLKSVRVFMAMNNVFTITSYPGLDPESTSATGVDSFNNNQDNDLYPLARTTSFGIILNF